ncbi:DUF2200 domain-containing protein [Leptospira kemamanensis]|uniref:DUF2200 domain-containing protein n=1 Tax=Leptospira kemamanensis TaxID=2484942 RepID=A0A4R9JRG9_9LEPT|nr:DUF2200 domain-containing protein [Leptospira kemamanensis]TGL52274.1 DUF2200 domain-containing protein [Leptospira kemamanensis]
MQPTEEHIQKLATMKFGSVYPLYLSKVEKKGKTKAELNQVITWLTSFDEQTIDRLIKENVSFEVFFAKAKLNENAKLIKGLICGYRVEEIQNPIAKKVRYLDKLVDELAKGKSMEKILRKPETKQKQIK